jgi:hypothetical protein
MRAAMGRVIRRVLPAKYWNYLQSVRSRNHQMRWLKQQGLLDIARRFSQSNGCTVLHGPFAGMKYPPESILTRHSVPLLLGSYESELHGVIGTALRSRYDLVIDIGSAEGYYAVGFALKGIARVVTFETDARELRLCQEMARLNQVTDRITTRNWCSPSALRDLTAGNRCFVLSDCEGYEMELFDDATVDGLRHSDVLIEIHGGAYEALLERFSKIHALRTLVTSARLASDYPELACLAGDAERAVREYRPAGQRWLYASSRLE